MSKKKWAVIGSSARCTALAGVTVLVVLLNRVKTIPYVEDEKFISKYTYKNQPTWGWEDPTFLQTTANTILPAPTMA